MNKAIFVDRDGVLNNLGLKKTIYYPTQFIIADGVKETLPILQSYGYKTIVITNQPEIARGTLTLTQLDEIHKEMSENLNIDDIFTCPHDDSDNCRCRKPEVGLLTSAAKKYNLDLTECYMVGDRNSDIRAGKNAGCTTIIIDKMYNQSVSADHRISEFSQILGIVDYFTVNYLREISVAALSISKNKIAKLINVILQVKKEKGRIFFLGVGGGAGNASHAVCDFRKLAKIDSYFLFDNTSELTARVNDDGWRSSFVNSLKISNLTEKDCVFVFSVGGGNEEKGVSQNIIEVLKLAKVQGSKIVGVVGREEGYTQEVADVCLTVPNFNTNLLTPSTESFQSIIWHLIVSHPLIKADNPVW